METSATQAFTQAEAFAKNGQRSSFPFWHLILVLCLIAVSHHSTCAESQSDWWPSPLDKHFSTPLIRWDSPIRRKATISRKHPRSSTWLGIFSLASSSLMPLPVFKALPIDSSLILIQYRYLDRGVIFHHQLVLYICLQNSPSYPSWSLVFSGMKVTTGFTIFTCRNQKLSICHWYLYQFWLF